MSPQDHDKKELEDRRIALRKRCRELAGHGHREEADEFELVAAWCRESGASSDAYGEGEFLQSFEARVADMLGFEAARFMPSGSMAQPIAIRIWSERSGCSLFGMHPTCHLELHEQQAYSRLHQLDGVHVGSVAGPMLAADLESLPERIGSLVVELPTRENGGQLPSFEQLQELVQLARQRKIRLHLDGARLWEAQASYERPFTEICAGFDSAYVSFYKGIGALPGAMLLGPTDFIEEAALWQRRQGGNLYSSLVSAASAAMRLEEQIQQMPRFRERALEVGTLLASLDGVHVLPDPPQTHMFHLMFDASVERLTRARDQVAEECGLWLVGGVRTGDRPDTCRSEVSIYEAALEIKDDELLRAFHRLLERVRE